MPRETDLLRVKLVAHTLLDVQIQKTSFSPVIVSHPFTNSGISALRNEDGSLSMVDLINNSDDCTRWRKMVGEQIDSAKNRPVDKVEPQSNGNRQGQQKRRLAASNGPFDHPLQVQCGR